MSAPFCGARKSILYRWMQASDFPEPLKIGPKAIRWRADEIQEWIDSRERAHGDASKSVIPVPGPGSPSELD